MEQINQENNQSLYSQIEVNYQDKAYIAYLKTLEGKVKISFTIQEQSHLKWQEQYSVDQSYKINKSFRQWDNLQEVFEFFEKLIKDQIKNISFKENNLVIEFEIKNFVSKKNQFSIQLVQCEFDIKEAIAILSEKNVNLKKQQNDYKSKSEQIIQDQLTQIQEMKQQLTLHEHYIQKLQNEFLEKFNPKMFSNIIKQSEIDQIKTWVSNTQIDLKLIYRATNDGFQIDKIYEKCNGKKKVILILKTIYEKRFGFYSDLEIKNYGGNYQAQNPNNIFLFSLDLKKKYTSNESNCPQAFYSIHNFLALGGGHDIRLETNSNANYTSYVYNGSHSYGKNQGLGGYVLNGGIQYFSTTEIEIFEIIDI